MEQIQQSGIPFHQWEKLKKLFLVRLKIALEEFPTKESYISRSGETYDERKNTVLEIFNAFEGYVMTKIGNAASMRL